MSPLHTYRKTIIPLTNETTVLIDADIVAYRCAASCENESAELAISRTNDLIQRIIDETKATSYNCYLTGGNNYRYQYNPDYKGNRVDTPRPRWLQPVREHLVTTWNASVEDGQEADDAMGIFQSANKNTIISSLDKDMHMIPGEHHSWTISGTSSTGKVWEKPGCLREISMIDANRHFYWQLLMGDKADNIFGFDGLARAKVPLKLQYIFDELASYTDEMDMFEFVRELYNDDDRLLMNGICLWIRRNEDEIWRFPG